VNGSTSLQPLSSLSYLSIRAIRARKSLIVRNPVYVRRVDPSAFVFSLSSHRDSYRSSLQLSLYRFIIHKISGVSDRAGAACNIRGMDSRVPWCYLWVGRCNDHEVLVGYSARL
jgi:hypothetical protein